MERKDRDLQTILSEDGKSSLMFDKARAEEHRTERATAFDHGHIVAIWKTEFNNYVRCIEAADSDDHHWQQISKGSAHIHFSERGLHHLVSDSELALLHGPEQIADLPVPVVESPGAVRIGHPERSHLVEYLAPNSVFNSLPRQRSSPHLRPDDRLVTIDRVLHHASLGVA